MIHWTSHMSCPCGVVGEDPAVAVRALDAERDAVLHDLGGEVLGPARPAEQVAALQAGSRGLLGRNSK